MKRAGGKVGQTLTHKVLDDPKPLLGMGGGYIIKPNDSKNLLTLLPLTVGGERLAGCCGVCSSSCW